jgi:hypothetical protein
VLSDFETFSVIKDVNACCEKNLDDKMRVELFSVGKARIKLILACVNPVCDKPQSCKSTHDWVLLRILSKKVKKFSRLKAYYYFSFLKEYGNIVLDYLPNSRENNFPLNTNNSMKK